MWFVDVCFMSRREHLTKKLPLHLSRNITKKKPSSKCVESLDALAKKCVEYYWWKKFCTSWYGQYPTMYLALYIPGGAGFPSMNSTFQVPSVSLRHFPGSLINTPFLMCQSSGENVIEGGPWRSSSVEFYIYIYILNSYKWPKIHGFHWGEFMSIPTSKPGTLKHPVLNGCLMISNHKDLVV